MGNMKEIVFMRFPVTFYLLLILIATSWFTIGNKIDLFEQLILLLNKFEHLELDEFLFFLPLLFLAMIFDLFKQHLKNHKKIIRLAVIDPLTKLFNRRYFYNALTMEINKVNRSGSLLAIMMLDLDHFKDINDQYGHQKGDEVLKKFASILSASLRKTDIVARVGGEEFLVLSIYQNKNNIISLANRICESVSSFDFGLDNHKRITVSIGVAFMGKSFQKITSDMIINQADEAMYEAKRNGRNNVKVRTITTP